MPQVEVDLRHRRQRHPARVGQGQGHRQGAEDPDRGLERPERRRDRQDGQGGRAARARGQDAGASEIEARNQLDSLVYQVEKDSKEWVDRLPADAKARLDAALEAGQAGPPQPATPTASGRALDELNAAYSAAGRLALPERPGAAPARGGPGRGSAGRAGRRARPQDDVVEADYEIVDEKK